MALTKIDDRGLTTPIDLLDNEKIRFGTGNDGEIYFDGTDSIFTSAGKFRFKHGTDTAIKTLVDGGVYLSHDNSIKFYTTASGIFVGGHIDLDDNSELQIGTGDDLKIYHNGTHSFINNSTGHLILTSTATDNVDIMKAGHSEYMARFKPDNSVELYHDNVKKLETTSAGLNLHEATDKVLSFSGGIGEIGSVPGFQGLNTAGSALTSIGMRGTDIRFAAGSAERGRFTDDGLTFNGDTAAANALDDYEEGTFTPSISSNSRSGTITYTNQVGFYTKIGNRVFAQVYINCGGGTNSNNDLVVDGLPYACVGTASHEGGGYHTYMAGFFTAEANRQNTPWVTVGTSSVRFYKISDGNGIKGDETSTSSNYLIFHVQYIAA